MSSLHFLKIQFSRSVVSDSLWSCGLQHTRCPCPSPTLRVYSNLCPLSQWCHPTISSSVIPFSSCLPSFPASGSFPMNWFFASCGQSIGVSALTSVLQMNIQDWFPLGWTGWMSFQSKGLSSIFSNTTVQKHQFFSTQLSSESFSHIHTWLLEKTIDLTRQTFVGKVMSLFFNMLSRLVIAFLSKEWVSFNFMAAVTIFNDVSFLKIVITLRSLKFLGTSALASHWLVGRIDFPSRKSSSILTTALHTSLQCQPPSLWITLTFHAWLP